MKQLIPFGKYKDQPIEQLQSDPEYTKWLLEQPWFAQRYDGIRTLIINNFKEVADTPEHNAMQARFLDKRFAFSVFCYCKRAKPFAAWLDTDTDAIPEKYKNAKLYTHDSIEFESKGWDIVLSFCAYHEVPINCNITDWGGTLLLELKPTIGEDFPGVLRQVKSRGGGYVIVDRFACESVSIQDVKKIFSTSRCRLVCLSDIPLIELPSVFA